jgi:arsenate reductase (thioredoxin)
MLNVLFLDSANTSHSLMAESILHASARGRFHAYSAGCLPAGAVSPDVVAFLRERNLPVEGLRSKALRELTGLDGPAFAFVITLSEMAAVTTGERLFSGDPVIARWHLDEESERNPSIWALCDSYWLLSRRIKSFTSLAHGKASRRALQNRLHAPESWQ